MEHYQIKDEPSRTNFKKLADFLYNNVEPRHFTMATFRDGQHNINDYREKGWKCGTVGCALGWAPFVAGLAPTKELLDSHAECGLTWTDYAEWLFPALGESSLSDQSAFSYCFGGEWANVDNSPRGAAQRIYYMLEHGVPDGWSNRKSELYLEYKSIKPPQEEPIKVHFVEQVPA